MKTAFVTGGTGFMGRNLIDQLLEGGWKVIALVRPESEAERPEHDNLVWVEGDVTDIKSLRQVISDDAEVIFHQAAITSLWSRHAEEQTRVNVGGTQNIVQVALEKQVARLVYTSSVSAFGMHSGVITEQTPSKGGSSKINYIRTKAQAEKEVRRGIQKGLDAVILNPAHCIGRYDPHGWSRLLQLVQQRRLPGVPPGGGSFCHAAEVARIHLVAAHAGKTGEKYLLGGIDTSYVNLLKEVCVVMDRKAMGRPVPRWILEIYASSEEVVAPWVRREPKITRDSVHFLSGNSYCSSRKAEKELGYRPVELSVMIQDCQAWMQDVGLL